MPMYVLDRCHTKIRSSSQVLIAVSMVTDTLLIFASDKVDSSYDPKYTIFQLFFVKQSQTITEPPPFLIVGTVHLGSNSSSRLLHSTIRPSDPNKLNFHLSDQTIVSPKPNGFRRIAYLRHLKRLVLFTYGFFRAIQPNSSTSYGRRLTVDSLISISRSFSNSNMTVHADFRHSSFNFR